MRIGGIVGFCLDFVYCGYNKVMDETRHKNFLLFKITLTVLSIVRGKGGEGVTDN